ncbi:hypothetical protein [Planomonospora alba]
MERLLAEVEREHARGTTDRDPGWVAWFVPMEVAAGSSSGSVGRP